MQDHVPSEEDRAEYRRRFEMNRQIMAPMIEGYQREATEYAKIIFRQLSLLNGGALLLVPTLFSSFGGEDPQLTLQAARYFVAGLVFVLGAAYASHLNFLFIAGLLQDEEKTRIENWKAELLRGEEDNTIESPVGAKSPRIWITFWISHLFGILSVLSLIFGAWTVMGTVQ